MTTTLHILHPDGGTQGVLCGWPELVESDYTNFQSWLDGDVDNVCSACEAWMMAKLKREEKSNITITWDGSERALLETVYAILMNRDKEWRWRAMDSLYLIRAGLTGEETPYPVTIPEGILTTITRSDAHGWDEVFKTYSKEALARAITAERQRADHLRIEVDQFKKERERANRIAADMLNSWPGDEQPRDLTELFNLTKAMPEHVAKAEAPDWYQVVPPEGGDPLASYVEEQNAIDHCNAEGTAHIEPAYRRDSKIASHGQRCSECDKERCAQEQCEGKDAHRCSLYPSARCTCEIAEIAKAVEPQHAWIFRGILEATEALLDPEVDTVARIKSAVQILQKLVSLEAEPEEQTGPPITHEQHVKFQLRQHGWARDVETGEDSTRRVLALAVAAEVPFIELPWHAQAKEIRKWRRKFVQCVVPGGKWLWTHRKDKLMSSGAVMGGRYTHVTREERTHRAIDWSLGDDGEALVYVVPLETES